jgi:Sulfotransferase family
VIERPVFIVAPPRSGATALLRSLSRGDGIFTAGENGHRVLDSIYELDPANRDWDSNRLTETDVAPRVVEELRANLKGTLVDRDGGRPGLDASGLRWLDATPRNALRVPFLNRVCPDALFVYVHREPRLSLREIVRTWRSGAAVTHPDLPGWPGPPWSLLLVPGWRDLAGKEVPEIAVEQWARTTRTLLDDLEKLPPERWCVAEWTALLRNPGEELERLASFAGIEADEDAALPLRALRDEVASAEKSKGDELDQELEPFLPRTVKLDERARDWLARPASASKAPTTPATDSPLRSVYTQSFPQFLEQLGSSLLVSTYQT